MFPSLELIIHFFQIKYSDICENKNERTMTWTLMLVPPEQLDEKGEDFEVETELTDS
jgi:hypothetical protein